MENKKKKKKKKKKQVTFGKKKGRRGNAQRTTEELRLDVLAFFLERIDCTTRWHLAAAVRIVSGRGGGGLIFYRLS